MTYEHYPFYLIYVDYCTEETDTQLVSFATEMLKLPERVITEQHQFTHDALHIFPR